MASYDVQTPDGGSYTVEADSPEQLDSAVNDLTGKGQKPSIPWSQVPGNAVQDIKGMGQGVLNVGKRLADPIGLYEAASKQSMEPIKQATMEPWNQLKGFASDIGQTIAHPIETFKQHPVGTAMNAAMVAAPVLGRMGAVGDGAEAAGEAGKIAEAPKAPIEPIASISKIHEGTGLPLNPDGTVTLYHGTTKSGLESIQKTGRLKSAGEPDVYLTTDPKGGDYGDGSVAKIKVDPNKLQIDDEFPTGRKDYRIDTGKPGGSIPIQTEVPPVAEAPKPIDLPPEVSDILNRSQKPAEMKRLYRVEPKDLGNQGEWLKKSLTPEQYQQFIGERGRLFGENLEDLKKYGHGSPETNTFYIDVPKDIAEKIKRPNVGSGSDFPEYLVPDEYVSNKKLLGSEATTPPAENPLSGIKEAIPEAIKKPTEEVADYLTQKYGDKPLNRGTLGAYANKSSVDLTMKTLGAARGQLQKIGEQRAEQLAHYAQDKGLVNMQTGSIGARQKLDAINHDAGQVVGDMRGMVAERGAVHNPETLLKDIHSKLGSKYESGTESVQQGNYIRALQDVAKTQGTPDAIAKTVTKLFQDAKNADKLKQPSGAYADVARELRAKNEALMDKHLDPTEKKLYQNALEDYGATTQIREFMKRKRLTEMAGRLPPGFGMVRGALQKGLDVVGYRGLAQLQNNVAKWLNENPKGTTTPKELFRHYADEAIEAGDEAMEGMQ